MAEVKRYDLEWRSCMGGYSGSNEMVESSDGEWLRYDDAITLERKCQELERERDELKAENARLLHACSKQQDEIQQTLGRALSYPMLCKDQENFPGSTEADGVCVGDHVAETLASEAAAELARLRAVEVVVRKENTDLRNTRRFLAGMIDAHLDSIENGADVHQAILKLAEACGRKG